jgi:hypothetical protein
VGILYWPLAMVAHNSTLFIPQAEVHVCCKLAIDMAQIRLVSRHTYTFPRCRAMLHQSLLVVSPM